MLEISEHVNANGKDFEMTTEKTYKCPHKCPIKKNCFIIKTAKPIPCEVTVLYKCPAYKKDIPICIGSDHPP